LKVVYAVESLELSGGVRVIVQHATALASRGHDVSIVSRHPPDGWIDVPVPVTVVPAFTESSLPRADVHVATWFPTVVPVATARRAQAIFHFCQGYEGEQSHLQHRLTEIHEAYSQKVPKLVVSTNLAARLEPLFPGPFVVVPPAVDAAEFAPRSERSAPGRPAIIGIVGPFELDLKGVGVCLDAVRRVEEAGVECVVHRVSQLPLSEEERLRFPRSVYSCALPASEMPRWYQGLDLLLFGSFPTEGLGLPALEAMAAGVPVVVTDIPSLEFLPSDAVGRVPPGDAEAMAREAIRLLSSPSLWGSRRANGLAVAGSLTLDRACDTLERAFAKALRTRRWWH
jgi:glycosyltransferase involved in cell wall biosynthesis